MDAMSLQSGEDGYKPRGTISLPSNQVQAEWIEQYEPGVYIFFKKMEYINISASHLIDAYSYSGLHPNTSKSHKLKYKARTP
jgi:hypothetical protein